MRSDDRAWVATVLRGRVVATRRLPGGISALTRKVLVERPDGSRVRAVLRRVGEDWMAAEPGLVDREAALLQELETRGVPAPRLIAHQPEGALLMTLEPGKPVHHPRDVRRHVAALVDAALRIHEGGPPAVVGLREQIPRLERDVQERTPFRHGWNVDEAAWDDVRRLWPSVSVGPSTLIHDDYHPGNVLWSRGRLTSVVDWTGAGVGQAVSDITYLRIDISLVLGLEAGDLVLDAYRAATGSTVPDLPFWDLFAAVRAVGVVHLWHGSWVDFGIADLPLRTVEGRLDAFVARARAAT